MKIAIVILNWNGKKLLEQFLPSVVLHANQATIYVADNASTDDSLAFLQAHYPTISIIKNKQNGGYAKGYNDALKNLTEDIFVLLNSDVAVTNNWLEPIINAFKTDASLAAAQPKILDFKNQQYFEYAGASGGFIDALGYPYCRGRIFNTLEKDTGQYDTPVEIFWATGACLFVRREAFNLAGGFDETLFAHQEEVDLCWRIQGNKGIIKCFPASKVYHVGGATLDESNPKKTFYNFRNSLLILVKNARSWVVLKVFLRLLLDGLAAIKFLAEGKHRHFVSVFKAHLSFYKYFFTFFKKRKPFKNTVKYYQVKSIVWCYFIEKKRSFSKLK